MAANLTIDKIFADNLGTAFGGCVRDQSLNLFSPEIARSAGANWNPLPFFGRAEKVRFRARWAALLQGIGLWAALVVIPELKADPKITSQMEAYTDALLKAPILDHLSPDEIRDYTLLRQRFMRLGAAASTVPDKDAFARAFLSALTGKAPNEAAPARVSAMALHVGLAYGLFAKLANRSPTSEIRRSAETTRIKNRQTSIQVPADFHSSGNDSRWISLLIRRSASS